MTFSDNALLLPLYGEYDKNLAQIEASLGISISSRGNVLTLAGSAEALDQAQMVLEELHSRATQGLAIELGDVEGALRMIGRVDAGHAARRGRKSAKSGGDTKAAARIQIRKKVLLPRSPTQGTYMQRLNDTPMVFGIGPAGTGKTYLAVAQAVSAMLAGQVDKIVLSRPAVEAGENLGFLPGDMREKVDPYLRPLYDALDDLLPADFVERRMQSGEIEIAPLAFMRGRTLSNSFVILDEAQNATVMQMKMFLTRFGENSHMVIAGDPSQVDLPPKVRSGLAHAVNTLAEVEGVAAVRFNAQDVVRHPLVGRIVDAYDRADKAERGETTPSPR
ncbi:MAG: PhoH family protein [Pseudomonadota bacterium]